MNRCSPPRLDLSPRDRVEVGSRYAGDGAVTGRGPCDACPAHALTPGYTHRGCGGRRRHQVCAGPRRADELVRAPAGSLRLGQPAGACRQTSTAPHSARWRGRSPAKKRSCGVSAVRRAAARPLLCPTVAAIVPVVSGIARTVTHVGSGRGDHRHQHGRRSSNPEAALQDPDGPLHEVDSPAEPCWILPVEDHPPPMIVPVAAWEDGFAHSGAYADRSADVTVWGSTVPVGGRAPRHVIV